MTDILIATSNQGKYTEMMEVLHDLPYQFLSLKDLGLKNDVEETEETFQGNALLKAQYFFEKTGMPTLGEDSGIEVSALSGELGIKTRRWGAGEDASDQEWLEFFLNQMKKEDDRKAAFSCCIAFLQERNTPHFFSGKSEGSLLQEMPKKIPQGIPLSAIFVPTGHAEVFSEMSRETKNTISHRGWATHALKDFLLKESIK